MEDLGKGLIYWQAISPCPGARLSFEPSDIMDVDAYGLFLN